MGAGGRGGSGGLRAENNEETKSEASTCEETCEVEAGQDGTMQIALFSRRS